MSGIAHDISERKRIEAKIRRSEQQLRLVTNASPILISYCDRDLRYTFGNQIASQWYAQPIGNLIGRTMQELMPPEVLKELLPNARRALQGEQVEFEYTRKFPDGRERHVSTSYVPDIAETGEARGFYIFITDLTDRYRAEAAARESAARMRQIVDALPGYLTHLGSDLRYRFVNRTAAEWLGNDAAASIGGFIEEVYNRQRLHSALGYRSPDEFEAERSTAWAAAQQPMPPLTANCR